MALATRIENEGRTVDDVHGRISRTRVREVIEVDSTEAVRQAIVAAAARGLRVTVAGRRHSMGAQAFGTGAVLLDTARLDRVLAFDPERRLVRVEAGITWPALIDALRALQPGAALPLTIAQKQTGADQLSLGGALGSNVHGRGLTLRPFVADVEAFLLVDARGRLHECSREREPELFSLVAGGYGLFGVVTEITLRLVPRMLLRRDVTVLERGELMPAFERRIAEGYACGDFQFDIDDRSPSFLKRGVFSCYRPVGIDRDEVGTQGGSSTASAHQVLTPERWRELLHLAHVDKAEGYRRYEAHYLRTDGQLYASDRHQLGTYLDGYHEEIDRRCGAAVPGSEVITELYVPRHRLEDFLAEIALDLRRRRASVVYGTVRLIERDEESFLAWAREPWACTVLNLHVDHSKAGLARAREAFRALIDAAARRGGSYYLTYHRFATGEQVRSCHPRMEAFAARRRAWDPEGRFVSDWWEYVEGELRG